MRRLLLIVLALSFVPFGIGNANPPQEQPADGARAGDAGALQGDSVAPAESAVPAQFDIWEYRVSGNTLLQVGTIERQVYGHLGEQRSFDDIEAARAGLESAYHDAGFSQVQVYIPQDQPLIDQGVVALNVLEATVERTWISGSSYFSARDLREQMPSVAQGRTINESAFRDDINNVNRRNPDLEVIPVLRPGKAPGTVEVELKVKDELPLHGGLEVNNQHSEDTSDLRVEVSGSYGNLWQRDHRLGLLAIFSPEKTDESRVISLNYMAPVGDGGDKLLGYYLNTSSDVETIGGLSVVGSGNIFGVNYIAPREGSATLFHTVMFGAEYRDVVNNTVGISEKPIDYLAWSATWMGRKLHGGGVSTDFNLKATLGIDGLVNTEDEFELNRIDAEPGFLLINVDLTHEWPVFDDATLRLRTAGQFTGQPLISNLQFAAGGVSTVRGYYEAQELRDNGVLTTLELVSPNLVHHLFGAELPPSVGKAELRVRAFVDAAWLWDVTPAANPLDPNANLASVGFGADLRAFDEGYASLDLANSLTDVGTVQAGDTRLHFSVGYAF